MTHAPREIKRYFGIEDHTQTALDIADTLRPMGIAYVGVPVRSAMDYEAMQKWAQGQGNITPTDLVGFDIILEGVDYDGIDILRTWVDFKNLYGLPEFSGFENALLLSSADNRVYNTSGGDTVNLHPVPRLRELEGKGTDVFARIKITRQGTAGSGRSTTALRIEDTVRNTVESIRNGTYLAAGAIQADAPSLIVRGRR